MDLCFTAISSSTQLPANTSWSHPINGATHMLHKTNWLLKILTLKHSTMELFFRDNKKERNILNCKTELLSESTLEPHPLELTSPSLLQANQSPWQEKPYCLVNWSSWDQTPLVSFTCQQEQLILFRYSSKHQTTEKWTSCNLLQTQESQLPITKLDPLTHQLLMLQL